MSRAGSRAFKLGMAAAMVLLLVAAAYTAVLIGKRQATVQEVTRYNTTWVLASASLEVSRLQGAIASAMAAGPGADESEVGLRLDIVDNRISVLKVLEVAEFVAASPVRAAIARQFIAVASEVRAEFEGGPGGRLARMHALVEQLHTPLARLAAAGHAHGGTLTLNDQSAISTLHWTFAAILGGVALCGLGLVGILAWQNRLLSRAKSRVRQQNTVLQLRDAALNQQHARFDAALNNMSEALCLVDAQQRLIVCNVRFLAMFGLAADAAQPGTPVRDVFGAAAASGRQAPALVGAIAARQSGFAVAKAPCRFTEVDAGGVALSVKQEPMANGGWVATFEDVTERRRDEAQISFLANHDALTGLPNRRLFHARLQDALDRHARSGDGVAVLCLDLDRFKQVNDTLGHAAGDSLLKSVAARLQACASSEGLVVRLSGDEFAVLLSDAPPGAPAALARRLVDALAQQHDIEGHPERSGVSIGIAAAGPGRTDADTLMRCADIAMYRAKREGRGTSRTFDDTMDAEVQARRVMAAELREALGRGEFALAYQPLFDTRTGRVCGFEALLRWHHPARGIVPPETFIPLAEDLGLVVGIGRWALCQACRDAAAWPDGVKVAVNLSPLQFRGPGLVGTVQDALGGAGLHPSRLELEITETVLLHDNQDVLGILRQLNGLGVCVALDDFGTGYSSLSYLRSFPFGKLKIDRSFIHDIAVRGDCEAIVRSVVGLAHMLGMATTAEGVEDLAQLDRLRAIGCTEVQGFLFDVPRPAGEVQRWFAAHPPAVPGFGPARLPIPAQAAQ